MAASIESGRMLLRRMTGADLDWLARLHGDLRVMRYIDDGKPVQRAVVVELTLPAILREYDELPGGLGCLAAVDRATGEPLGWIGLRPPTSTGLDSVAGAAELGYRLFPEVWGLGYATEGAGALIRHAFTELDLTSIVATTMTLNLASGESSRRPGCRWSAHSWRRGRATSRAPSTVTWSMPLPGQRGRRDRYQPSSRSRSSPMPKWCATSWMTVLRTWSSTSHSDHASAQIARR